MGIFGSKYSEPHPVESKWFGEFEKTLPDLKGKVIAVTGCTSGTGLVCAMTCAKKGAHVILLNRESERSKNAYEKIKECGGGGKVTNIACDLQSFESVKSAAEALKKSVESLDVLCNNAGVMALEDKATGDGYDVQMQTNYLSHYLLTKECIPLLKKAAEKNGEARVVNHSSGARIYPGTDLDEKYYGKNGGDLGGNGSAMFFGNRARWERYHQTKLANAVFTVALAEAFKNTKLKAACAAPGLSSTNLQVTSSQQGGMESTWIMRFAQSAEDGTMPLLQCCVGADVQNGDLWEPNGRAHMTGPAAKHDFEPICTKPEAVQTLLKASEAACGPLSI